MTYLEALIESAEDYKSRSQIQSELILERNAKHARMFATRHSVDQEMAIQQNQMLRKIVRQYAC